MKLLVPILLTFIAVTSANAGAFNDKDVLESALDPHLNYFTIYTPHFRLHSESNLENLARSIAEKIEPLRDKALDLCDCTFTEIVDIVITYNSDQVAIFTSAFPTNRIFLNVAKPTFDSGLNNYTDWYLWVLSHEYMHSIHLSKREHDWKEVLFGNWYRPNQLRPAWLKEGIAVFSETKINATGRYDSTEYRSYLRAAVIESQLDLNDFASLTSVANFSDTRWPWTIRPYLLGSSLTKELLTSSAAITLKDLLQPAEKITDSAGNDLAKRVGFEDLKDLWNATKAKITKQAKREIEEALQNPISKFSLLTNDGYYYYGIELSPDEKFLFTTHDKAESAVQILRIPLDKTNFESEMITTRASGYSLSLSKTGRYLAYDQVTHQDRFNTFNNGYLYDLKTKSLLSGSPMPHVRDVVVHPDGKRLVFVLDDKDTNQLCISSSSWTDVQVLVAKTTNRISRPKISNDQTSIVYSVHNEKNGAEEVWLLDQEKNIPLVADGHVNLHPVFSFDSKSIFFSSDRSGIYNIYELQLPRDEFESKPMQLKQWTNVLTAAQFPAVTADKNKLYFVLTTANGTNIAEMPLQNPIKEFEETKVEPEGPSVSAAISDDVKPPQIEAYNIYHHLAPNYLYPSIILRPDTAQIGFTFGADDPLGFNNYLFDIHFDTRTKSTLGDFNLHSIAFDENLFTQISRQVSPVANANYQYEEWSANTHFDLPIFEDSQQWLFQPGGQVSEISEQQRYRFLGPAIGVLYNSEQTDSSHLYPTDGFFLNSTYRAYLGTKPSVASPQIIDVDQALNLAMKAHYKLNSERSVHLQFNGNYFLSAPKLLYPFWAGGLSSFPFSYDSQMTLPGYSINSITGNRISILESTFSNRLSANHDSIFNYLVSRSFSHVNLKLYLADSDLVGALSSAGIEWIHQLTAGNIYDLNLKLGIYRGDAKFSGENQFYLILATKTN